MLQHEQLRIMISLINPTKDTNCKHRPWTCQRWNQVSRRGKHPRWPITPALSQINGLIRSQNEQPNNLYGACPMTLDQRITYRPCNLQNAGFKRVTPVTLLYLWIVCLDLKFYHTHNMLSSIESIKMHKHHMQEINIATQTWEVDDGEVISFVWKLCQVISLDCWFFRFHFKRSYLLGVSEIYIGYVLYSECMEYGYVLACMSNI